MTVVDFERRGNLALVTLDRPDARIKEVIDEVYELFLDLGANEEQIDFPIVYTNARAGTATRDMERPGTDLVPLLDCVLETAPAPLHEPGHPLQVLITNLAANDFVGRIAVGRIRNGVVRKGARITVVRDEGTVTGTVTSLTLPQGIERYLRHVGVHAERSFEFDATDPLLSLVASGLGWALSTPLCLWQSRHYLDAVRVVPLPAARLGQRHFFLLSREGEWAGLDEEVARVTREVIRRDTAPSIRKCLPALPDSALHCPDEETP